MYSKDILIKKKTTLPYSKAKDNPITLRKQERKLILLSTLDTIFTNKHCKLGSKIISSYYVIWCAITVNYFGSDRF